MAKEKFKIEVEANGNLTEEQKQKLLDGFKNNMAEKFGPEILEKYDFEISATLLSE